MIQIEQHVQDISEIFFAVTDQQATKVGANSVLEGFLYAIAKTGQMINKDVMNLIADFSLDNAIGSQLDTYATNNGFPIRNNSTQSSTYILLIATEGTIYVANTHQFISNTGELFNLIEDVTISSLGFAYAKIISVNSSKNTNVAANTIVKCSPAPAGHLACSNDFQCTGGRDIESDTDYRNRLKQTFNILAIDTISKYEQIFNKINNRVLKVYKGGINNLTGNIIFYLASINGADFTESELTIIKNDSYKYLSISEQEKGIELLNINYLNIDFSARLDLQADIDINKFRTELQISFQRKYDYRYIEPNSTINRLDLLLITQKNLYVKKILDKYFLLNGYTNDITIPELTLPRFRSFQIYDINGTLISDNSNLINSNYSTFWVSKTDLDFQSLLFNL